LTNVANGKTKSYIVASGTPGNAEEEPMNDDLNDICRLVELRLMLDISDEQRWSAIHEEQGRLGRQVLVVNLTHRGQWMFERVKWDKWVN